MPKLNYWIAIPTALIVCFGIIFLCRGCEVKAESWTWLKSENEVAYVEMRGSGFFSRSYWSEGVNWLNTTDICLYGNYEIVDSEIVAFREPYIPVKDYDNHYYFTKDELWYVKIKVIKGAFKGEFREGYLDPFEYVKTRRKQNAKDIGGFLKHKSLNELLHSKSR